MIGEFKAFLTKTNALALAVGVIIGAAVSSVVAAVNADVLMPIISLFLPSGDWRQAKIVLKTTTDASGKVTENAITYGHLLGTAIDFLIISIVLFFTVRALVKPSPKDPTKKCPECLETIPAAAKRCRACTATQTT